MKAMLMVLFFLVASNAYSQEKYLSISNPETGKVSVFKENKRIRVKTIQGGKLNGKLKIVDDNQVMIKDVIIPISSIEKIKNNPIALNILVSGGLIIIGGYGVLGGLVVLSWSGNAVGYLILGAGAGIMTAGILSPNFLPSVNINKLSNVRIVTME